jgi:hypothetical protein
MEMLRSPIETKLGSLDFYFCLHAIRALETHALVETGFQLRLIGISHFAGLLILRILGSLFGLHLIVIWLQQSGPAGLLLISLLSDQISILVFSRILSV